MTSVANVVILDTRPTECFAAGHVASAIHVPWGPSFCQWGSMVLPWGHPLAVIVERAALFDAVCQCLAQMGFHRVSAYCFETTIASELALPQLTVQALKERADVTILDVRTDAEWHMGHIERAKHMELSVIAEALELLPREASYGVICGSGVRSTIAASLLRRAGLSTVYNIYGGMQAWYRAG